MKIARMKNYLARLVLILLYLFFMIRLLLENHRNSSRNSKIDSIISGLTSRNLSSSPATIMPIMGLMPLNLQPRMDGQEFQEFVESSPQLHLSIGNNDYIRLYVGKPEVLINWNGPKKLAQSLVKQIEKAVMNLHSKNARKIVLFAIGPSGCSPGTVLYKSHDHDHGQEERVEWVGYLHCVDEINDFVIEYNRVLSQKLTQLRSELPHTEIVFCDVYKWIIKIITRTGRYRFKKVSRAGACCGGGGEKENEIGCISEDMISEDDSRTRLWWHLYGKVNLTLSLVDSMHSSSLASLGDLCDPITVEELAYLSSKAAPTSPI